MKAFFAQHRMALDDAKQKLFASPLSTILSLVMIGAAMALPAAGLLVLDNLKSLAGGTPQVQQISLFMTASADREAINEIETRLRAARAGNWRFVSRDEAFERLKLVEGVSEILESLPKNPLPDAFVVEPADIRPEAVENLAQVFSSWPNVAHVQLDSDWVRRLDVFLRIGKLAIFMLAGLFGGALVIITFNTIRLQILAQASEIEVTRLIGATNAFIRRPFQYFGLLQGFLGGLFASLLIFSGSWLLSEPLDDLVALYGAVWNFHGLSFETIAEMAAIGAFLGWFGAFLSVTVHLKRMG